MFKKALYVLVVLVFLTGCAPKVLTQTPTVVPEEFSPVPPAETAAPLDLTDPCTLNGKKIDLISYQEIEGSKLHIIMKEWDSGRLVAVTITHFIYYPLTVENGITTIDHSTMALTDYSDGFFGENPKFQDTFPPNSSGSVYCRIGDGYSRITVTGFFSPTERDLVIQGLVDSYQANRDIKTEMLGVRALHFSRIDDPSASRDENMYFSLFEDVLNGWEFPIPSVQCWYMTRSYKEWGTDWKQYTELREMCGFKDDMLSLYGWSDPYKGLAIDFADNGNMGFQDFNRYYSYASGMLPSVFDPTHAQEEICPGGQVSLPNGMTGTAYESTHWVDIYGGFVFDYGIDFVVSFGEQHFFIPFGGYFVVTDAAHTPEEYALFTTCSER